MQSWLIGRLTVMLFKSILKVKDQIVFRSIFLKIFFSRYFFRDTLAFMMIDGVPLPVCLVGNVYDVWDIIEYYITSRGPIVVLCWCWSCQILSSSTSPVHSNWKRMKINIYGHKELKKYIRVSFESIQSDLILQITTFVQISIL